MSTSLGKRLKALIIVLAVSACATVQADSRRELHGLDPAKLSVNHLTAHCVEELRRRNNKRPSPASPVVTHCVREHESMVIDALLRRLEAGQSEGA